MAEIFKQWFESLPPGGRDVIFWVLLLISGLIPFLVLALLAFQERRRWIETKMRYQDWKKSKEVRDGK